MAELTKENPAAGVAGGYYLVMDEAGDGEGDAASGFIVTVAGKATFSPKSVSVPGFDKIIDKGRDTSWKANGTLSITDPMEGYQYDFYQIFTGKPDGEGNFESLQYVQNYGTEGEDAPADALNGIDEPYAFAAAIRDDVTGDAMATLNTANTETELESGYYLVEETETASGKTVDVMQAVAGDMQYTVHVHDYTGEETKAPTCTEDGIKIFTCICGDSYTESIDAAGHDYSVSTKESTCTVKGSETFTCNRCNDSYTNELPLKNHNLNDDGICTDCSTVDTDVHKHTSVETATTCTAAGKTVYTCVCGDSYETVIPKTEHQKGTAIQEKAPACTAAGQKVSRCTICNTIMDTESIPATVHNYINGSCNGCGVKDSNFDLSPDAVNTDWDYTLNEADGTVTLNYYKGTKEDVKVYSYYNVPNKNNAYKTVLKSNTDSIGINDTQYMFSRNEIVKSITFSDKLDTSTCTGMAYMFACCKALTKINWGSSFNT